MKSSSRNHKAFSAVIIAVVLAAAAVLALLITVLVKNYTNPNDSANSNSSEKSQSTDALSTGPSTYCTRAEKLCFDIPSGWQVKDDSADKTDIYNNTNDNLTISKISNPEEAIKFRTGLLYQGGTCGDNGDLSILTDVLSTSLIDSSNSSNYSVMRYAEKIDDIKYGIYIGISSDELLKNSSGKTISGIACAFSPQILEAKNATYLNSAYGDTETPYAVNKSQMQISAEFYDPANKDNSYDTLEAAKSALESDYYVTASRIIASAHY